MDNNSTQLQIKKPNDDEYKSLVDEYQKSIRNKVKIGIKAETQEKAFERVVKTIRVLFKIPNKDISNVGTLVMIDKLPYKIKAFEENKKVVFRHENSKSNAWTEISLLIKKSKLIKKHFKFIYKESNYSGRKFWGLKDYLIKLTIRSQFKVNVKKIKKELFN